MRNIFYTCLLFLFLSGITTTTKGEDTLVFPKEYRIVESIALDTTIYNNFKNDHFYKYQAKAEEKSFFKRLLDKLFHRLRRNAPSFERSDFNLLIGILAIVALAAIVVTLYLYHPSLFYFNRKNKLAFSIEEDIHGRDFNQLIREALNKGEYTEAIRWTYLKTLKALHEKKYISWDANKTVNEYTYEISNTELRKIFKKLSEEFVYYRYGNGKANLNRFETFYSQNEELTKWTTNHLINT